MSAHSTDLPYLEEEPLGGETLLPAPEEVVFRMRQAILDGDHWFEALLDGIARWRTPAEQVGSRHFQYLIHGEAFDWLLLAERLLDEAPDLVPPAEREALLWENRWPLDIEDHEFAARLGRAKYSAHLNFLYGVLVEQALQLSVEEEIHKEGRSRAWGTDLRMREGRWDMSKARSYARDAVPLRDPGQLRLNSYRVLLTRGREGSVIFVPPLDELDETASYFTESGIRSLDR